MRPLKYIFNRIFIKHFFICASVLLFSFTLQAQEPISLKAAIDSAWNNNLNLKSDKLQANAYEQLTKTGWNVQGTNITGEYGQFNSVYNDNKIGIAQTIKFPTVYANQKLLLQNEWKNAKLSTELKKVSLKKEVSTLFYTLIYTQQLEQLLLETDSLYAQFANRVALNFKVGESNILEKNAANWQRTQIAIQLQQVKQSYANYMLEFNYLINTKNRYLPEGSAIRMDVPNTVESNSPINHLSLQLLEQQKQINTAKVKLEKSLFMPDITAGFNSITIKGVGADDVYYSRSTRFNAIYAGIDIPLFYGATKHRLKALKIEQQIAENELKAGTQKLQSQIEKAKQEMSTQTQIVALFESSELKSANETIDAALLQLNKGNINYLEWMMLSNQVISIKTDYLNAVKNFNYSIIELNYLTGK